MAKKKLRKIRITVGSFDEAIKEIMKTCRRLDKGLPVTPADPELSFANIPQMLSNLSKKRMEIIMYLRQHKSLTVRQLAKNLKRDYRMVEADVKLLLQLGLVKTNKDKQIFVPWDELIIELPLTS